MNSISVRELMDLMMYGVDVVEIHDGVRLLYPMSPERFAKECGDMRVSQFWIYETEDEITLEVMFV